jgi:hypothetical protein
MATSKFKKKYCKEVKEYFLRFIELRDDPKEGDKAERSGMVPIVIENGRAAVQNPPSTGYPTLTKFAIKIGVSPRTITNWRKEDAEFDEACEFAEAMFKDILEERALTSQWDSKTAMKILELRANAKETEDSNTAVKVIFDIKDDREGERITIKNWDGEVNEDHDY